ncbi:polysaccharide lyase family 7 protein [Alienimonas californiensis]|uniref:Alginate lyase n=1 Tax=Alienimonas californiensis TaxID=2527989 RepID=A0A517PEY0_9PLAN|nr:polysaccharide lyase family 7 protein [Alienimonas californiensis]QDT17941.1 Alginate lyase precursor [Alienimonas californiensis]
MSPLLVFVLPLSLFTTGDAPATPGAALDLGGWKLTLPVDTPRAGSPDEVPAGELGTFVDPRFFFLSDQPSGVAFRAPCGGRTTKNSGYPRCELRELTADGAKPAAWATGDGGRHTLTATLAVTALPAVKPHVVCAQIHDADDDLLMVRLEGRKLFVERNDVGDVPLDGDYRLGTPFELKIEAADGVVRVWYEGELKLSWPVKAKGCYFKVGCYTQSNVAKGDAADAYGEVVVSRLRAEHSEPN